MLEPLSALVLIIALGVGAEWLANSFGIPSIALLLVAGVLVGPATGLIEPDLLLGDLLFPTVSLAVAVVLFEGGMNLRFSDFRSVRTPVLLLTTVGAAITWAGGSLAGWWLFGFHPEVAMLLGAILVVTGPTVVIPLLRNMEVRERLETVATWEGIVNDPIGAVLAVSVYEL
ncbi:MAG: cation:proton antiporter, partial [Bradymonadaceae bacterium]